MDTRVNHSHNIYGSSHLTLLDTPHPPHLFPHPNTHIEPFNVLRRPFTFCLFYLCGERKWALGGSTFRPLSVFCFYVECISILMSHGIRPSPPSPNCPHPTERQRSQRRARTLA